MPLNLGKDATTEVNRSVPSHVKCGGFRKGNQLTKNRPKLWVGKLSMDYMFETCWAPTLVHSEKRIFESRDFAGWDLCPKNSCFLWGGETGPISPGRYLATYFAQMQLISILFLGFVIVKAMHFTY